MAAPFDKGDPRRALPSELRWMTIATRAYDKCCGSGASCVIYRYRARCHLGLAVVPASSSLVARSVRGCAFVPLYVLLVAIHVI